MRSLHSLVRHKGTPAADHRSRTLPATRARRSGHYRRAETPRQERVQRLQAIASSSRVDPTAIAAAHLRHARFP